MMRHYTLYICTGFLIFTSTTCQGGEKITGDQEVFVASKDQAEDELFESFHVTGCEAADVMESKSPLYSHLKAKNVPQNLHHRKFSKPFTEEIDIRAQDITKYTHKTGFRIYEADPVIVFRPYEGSRSQVRHMLNEGIKADYWPGNARYGYRYHWEKGAFVKDPQTGHYYVEPTKFKVYLSFRIRVPEWRHVKAKTSSKDKRYWNGYICNLYTHERKHVEITRRHILSSIDETLDLKAQSYDKLESLVRKTWKYKGSELRAKQKDFDEGTNHGARAIQ